METITLGSSPWGEDCAQTAHAGYDARAQIECAEFAKQLRRHAAASGVDLAGVTLMTVPHPHDFGTYYEVSVEFDEKDKAQVDAAYWLEGKTPENWDDVAREALGLPALV